MKKTLLGLMVFLLMSSVSYSLHIRDVAPQKGELYFYSGGHKVPLVIHPNVVGVQFDSGVSSEQIAKELDGVQTRSGSMKVESFALPKQKLARIRFPSTISKSEFAEALKALRSRQGVHFALPALRLFGSDSPMVLTDTFFVQFDRDVSREQIDEMNSENGVEIVSSLSFIENGFLMRVLNPDNYYAVHCANVYYEKEEVRFAHPDFMVIRQLRLVPDDALYPNQWHLNNVGQSNAIIDQDVDAPEAWDINTGDPGVIVAIIDEGIDIDHEDLAMKVVFPFDAVGDDNDPRPDGPGENHGTAVSGVAVAKGNNTLGVAGVAYECGLMPIRLIGAGELISDEVEAFVFAVDNGAAVISNSWGPRDNGPFFPMPDVLKEAVDYGVETGRGGKGCIFLFAAGNGNEDIATDGYASYEKVIAVAASTDQGRRSSYSDFGEEVDVNAPSNGGLTSGIWTTDIMGDTGYSSNNYYSRFGGTSAATPCAAGVCALIISEKPELNYIGVRSVLEQTAEKIDQAGGNYNEDGHSNKYGYGRVNAFNALKLLSTVDDTISPSAITDLTLHGDMFKISWTAPGDDDGSGTASIYDLRFLDEPITGGNFVDAIEIEGEPRPKIAGTVQSFLVAPGKYAMKENETYYLAMKTYDEYGNLSNLSNSVGLQLPTRETLFFDDFESGTGNFSSLGGNWAETDTMYHSFTTSLTDSPGGNYNDSSSTSAVLNPFDLTGNYHPTLSFFQKYDIEEGYDFGFVEVSTNGGFAWSLPLSVTTGTQGEFIEALVDLSDYSDYSDVRIRFRFVSDPSVNEDGWYIDDVELLSFASPINIAVPNWMLY